MRTTPPARALARIVEFLDRFSDLVGFAVCLAPPVVWIGRSAGRRPC